eukprot:m.293432 g.293432  ORF g.293432 m.293432 type:complete len:508 (-) comp20019_c0_seq1:242-1765(-)
MGRITVFSLESCPHCKRAKAIMDERGWEYTNINLSAYPEKRADMLKLADRLTVPQIFFNEKHVGGATDFDYVLEEGWGDTEYKELIAAPDPTAPEIQAPTYEPKPQPKQTRRQEEIVCIGEKCLTYNDMVHLLETEVDIQDRTYRASLYRKCFIGRDFVTFLVDKYQLKSREEAVQVGQSMVRLALFHHVLNEHDFKDEYLFYRLQSHEEPTVLNSRRKWADRVDNAIVTVHAVKKLQSDIQGRHTTGGAVNYIAMGKDDDWRNFEDAVCEFQKLDLMTLTEDERLAFIVNLYNVAIIHAFVKVGIAKTDFKRYSFFDHVCYDIGGHNYSLNDLENGILRGNKTAPFHLYKPFGKSDPRRPTALPRGNFYIHFALNCGATSCPPIKKFTPEAVHEELKIAGMAFFEDDSNARVDEKSKTLFVSQILNWYSSDFGPDKLSVATVVASLLRGKKKEIVDRWIAESNDGKSMTFKLRHMAYDWTTNASESLTYKPSDLKIKEGRVPCSIM